MKWEVGKYYRTEKGRKARIYTTDGGGLRCLHGAVFYPVGWLPHAWTDTGFVSLKHSSDDDLVGEWSEPEPPRYRHYSHEELKTFIGKVVICKATGLPELIVGMVNECTVRLSVKEATSFDLLVMYEWADKTPCGVLVTTGSCVGAAIGDGIADNADILRDHSWGIMGRPVDSWESMGRGRPSETVE